MDILLALVVATVASFVGSLQAGLVNTAVLAATLRHGRTTARHTAWGGALPEFLYAGIAFVAANRVLDLTRHWGIRPEQISGVVMVGLGLYIALLMKPFHVERAANGRSGFVRGLFVGLMNPQLILFWCGVRLGMEAIGMRMEGWAAMLGFSLGAFAGALILLLLLVRLGEHLQQRLSGHTLHNLFRAVGALLVVVGVWVFFKH
jgi:threonine/homoserine/homoserine lactone efflux protein